jgi:hypothetical protein
MKTRLILKPGQRGTKRLMAQYGDALVCVRYRYDAEQGQRIKTVELVVERVPWTSQAPRYPLDALVPLRIAPSDLTLRAIVKAAGGRWNSDEVLWYVRYGSIVGSPLENYLAVDAFKLR